MADEILSPNMNLKIPSVGQTEGPDYADDVNSCFNTIDTHDHSSGSGVQVTPAGININSDLSCNNYNLVEPKSVRFYTQPAPLSDGTDLNCLYNVGVDLYFNDGNGTQIKITDSGNIAGTSGSIANLDSPASATYVLAGAKIVFQSDANVAASLDCRNLILRNAAASSFGLTLSPPNSMGGDYSIVLPTLPATTRALTLSNGGNMGTITYDAIGQAMTATGANAIADTTTRTVSTTVGLGGVAISASSGTFSTDTTVAVDVTNLSVTITTSGKPVQIMMIGDGSGNASSIGVLNVTDIEADGSIFVVRAAAKIAEYEFFTRGNNAVTTSGLDVPSSTVQFVDPVAAGTYTYKIQAAASSANLGNSISVNYTKLVAYELR